MINSTNTVNIDGAAFKEFDLKKAFESENQDFFSCWVARPLALLAAVGVGVAIFLASAFLAVVSLALLPLLAVALWAMKTKLQRDLASNDATIIVAPKSAEEDIQTNS